MPYLSRFGSYWEKLKNGCKSLKHRWISRERGINENCGKTRKTEKPWKIGKTALVRRSRRRPVEIGLSHLLTTSQHSLVSFVTVLEYCADWTPLVCPNKFVPSSLSQLMHHQFTFASNRVRPTSHTHYRVIRWFLVRNQQLYNVYNLILIGGILPCKSVMVSYNIATLHF